MESGQELGFLKRLAREMSRDGGQRRARSSFPSSRGFCKENFWDPESRFQSLASCLPPPRLPAPCSPLPAVAEPTERCTWSSSTLAPSLGSSPTPPGSHFGCGFLGSPIRNKASLCYCSSSSPLSPARRNATLEACNDMITLEEDTAGARARAAGWPSACCRRWGVSTGSKPRSGQGQCL